jgi:RNA polymerase primary sigma factor
MVVEVREILKTLTDRERKVMALRLGFEGDDSLVLQEIGEEMQISRERVRQIEAQAIKRLRAAARNRKLRDYLAE